MLKLLSLFLLATIALSSAEAAETVVKIEHCPTLSPRNPPKSVHDFRPDDIKVIGALGDSIATGYAMFNLGGSIETLKEYRGLNFFIGGDEGAPTVPNYIKHYQPNLTGYSLGSHFPEFCDATTCEHPHESKLDNLNVAQTGAATAQLSDQVGYLLERMQSLENVDFENDWKMITLQVGINSMCRFCALDKVGLADTPEKYGHYIQETLDLIQAKIPKVIVNLLDNFNTTQIFESASRFGNYCVGSHDRVDHIAVCPCAATEDGFKKMIELYSDYNKVLNGIYQKSQQKENRSDNFAVVYQQLNMDFSSCPKEFFSNFDCLHASPLGHDLVSKVLWNQLFKPQADKPKSTKFRFNETIYCPSDSDRFITY